MAAAQAYVILDITPENTRRRPGKSRLAAPPQEKTEVYYTYIYSFCAYTESKVIDSRPAEEGGDHPPPPRVPLLRQALTTYEIIERLPLVVIKRDGSRQTFDKVKLINGMVRACEKRPVPLSALEQIGDDIEQELQGALEREVSTTEIGEMVMDRLKDVDEVAYVRFASVYRSFKDINTFMEELTKLLKQKESGQRPN